MKMILREYRKEDAEIICRWSDTEEAFYKWSADRYNKYPLYGKDIDDKYSLQTGSGRFFPLTAVDDDGNLLGHFIIRYPRENDDSTVRFGFVIINPEMRGKGCGREMIRLGVQYVKEKLHVPRIDLGVFVNNEPARRCYEAAGFREYKRRKCTMPIGTWDCIDMELILDGTDTG